MKTLTENSKKATSLETASPLVSIFKRMKEDKEVINAFFKGEKTIEELNARGIKFIQPL